MHLFVELLGGDINLLIHGLLQIRSGVMINRARLVTMIDILLDLV